MYTVYCGNVCCKFRKLSDSDYFARKIGTVVFGIALPENDKGVKNEDIIGYVRFINQREL